MQMTAIPAIRNTEKAIETEERMTSELDRLQMAIVDANAPSLALQASPVETWDRGMPTEARGVIEVKQPGSEDPIRLNILSGAHQQIANKLDIPWKYYLRMLERHSDLWADSVNTWLHENNKTRLLRMLRPMTETDQEFARETGTLYNLRAFLSDRYHIIDHKALIDNLLPILRQNNAYVSSFNLSDQHFHLRFSTEEVEILQQFVDEQPRLQGMEEIVSFGGALRNSETGHGAFKLGPAVNIKRCVNVLVHTDKMRIVHLGGRSSEEEGFFRRSTMVLDDAATFAKIEDRTIQIFSRENTEKIARTIAEEAGKPFVIPEEVHYIEFIGNVGKQLKMAEEEIHTFKNEFVSEAANTGRVLDPTSEMAPTRWTVSQAMTAAARKLDEQGRFTDFDRREEMETLGWEILTTPTSRLLKAARASSN